MSYDDVVDYVRAELIQNTSIFPRRRYGDQVVRFDRDNSLNDLILISMYNFMHARDFDISLLELFRRCVSTSEFIFIEGSVVLKRALLLGAADTPLPPQTL